MQSLPKKDHDDDDTMRKRKLKPHSYCSFFFPANNITIKTKGSSTHTLMVIKSTTEKKNASFVLRIPNQRNGGFWVVKSTTKSFKMKEAVERVAYTRYMLTRFLHYAHMRI